MPCEPTVPVPEQAFLSNGSYVRDRLEKFCCSVQHYATSKTEKEYVEQLRTSCAALDEEVGNIPEPPIVAPTFKVLLREYLHDCKAFFQDMNHTLSNIVRKRTLFSDRIGIWTDQSIRLCPQFWLRQLHRDRFESLSDAWKSVIIKYGVAITHLHRASRLVALSQKSVDLYEELRHVGHSNWDPLQFPETLLLEAESGIMVRKEQELVASHMRSPQNGENAVLQLLMGGGKSSTIVPMLGAHFTDKKK